MSNVLLVVLQDSSFQAQRFSEVNLTTEFILVTFFTSGRMSYILN